MKKRLFFNLLILFIFFTLYYLILQNFLEKKSEEIQQIILKTEVPLYFSSFILFISLVLAFKNSIYKSLKIFRKNLKLILLVFFLAFTIREIIPPKTTRLFFDEDIYLDMAKQIVTHFSSCLCDFGNKFECFRCELMKWPVAHPFLLSLPFSIFGTSEMVATHFMIFLSSLSTIFIFLSSYLIFKNEKIAFLSSLILAILPIHILWSVTKAADITFSFFTSLLLFFSLLSSKSNDIKIHFLSLLALILAIQAKSEAIILIPLYFLTQLMLNQNYFKLFEKKSYVFSLIFTFSLAFTYFLHTFYAFKTDTWGGTKEKMCISYLNENLLTNLKFWFELPALEDKWAYEGKQLYHPFIFTLMACLGLATLIKNNFRVSVVLLSWFVAMFLMYASFYAGSVYWGVDVRYVLPQYIPFSLISAYGFYFFIKILKRRVKENTAFLLLLIFLVFYFSLYIPKMHINQENIEESYGARLYRNSIIDFASKQPDNCYFISHVSSIYSWLGKGHMQIWYVYQPDFDSIIKEKDCVIFDEGYWCAIKVSESQSCVEFNKKYELKLLKRVYDTKENKVYSLYKIVV